MLEETCRAALKSWILRIASSFLSLKSWTGTRVRGTALKSRTNFLPPERMWCLSVAVVFKIVGTLASYAQIVDRGNLHTFDWFLQLV